MSTHAQTATYTYKLVYVLYKSLAFIPRENMFIAYYQSWLHVVAFQTEAEEFLSHGLKILSTRLLFALILYAKLVTLFNWLSDDENTIRLLHRSEN